MVKKLYLLSILLVVNIFVAPVTECNVKVQSIENLSTKAAVSGATRAIGQVINKRKAIIFDSTGVLYTRSTAKALKKMGLNTVFGVLFGCPSTLIKNKERLFEYMWKVPCSQESMDLQMSDQACTAENGFKLPPVMVDCHKGLVTPEYMYTEMEKLEYRNKSERDFILGATSIMLPENLAATMAPDKKVMNLLKDLKEKGYVIVLFSNYDSEGYKALRAKYSEYYDVFDHIFISAEIGMVKPMVSAYKYVADKIGVSPEDCIMVDDQHENIEGAEEAGMVGVFHKSFAGTKKAFYRMGII